MGTKSVAEIIMQYRYVSNVRYEYNSKLEFDYKRTSDYLATTVKVYMPDRDHYEISVDAVDLAIEYGAHIIVYDVWAKATVSAESYADRKGLKIYSYGFFLRKIKNGEAL